MAETRTINSKTLAGYEDQFEVRLYRRYTKY